MTRDTGAPWSAAHPADLNSILEETPRTGEQDGVHAVAGSNAVADADSNAGSGADAAAVTELTHGVREENGNEQRMAATRTMDGNTDVNAEAATAAIAGRGPDAETDATRNAAATTVTATATRAHETLCREGAATNGLRRLVSSRRSQWRDMEQRQGRRTGRAARTVGLLRRRNWTGRNAGRQKQGRQRGRDRKDGRLERRRRSGRAAGTGSRATASGNGRSRGAYARVGQLEA
jgi:hypothetical protein